ncbi:hypothetical protein BJF92_04020 [Rhizobium rhizosphaerae]|uniref:YjiS-like domain-containing protein n=1 Tax=Xaviernesmea rhizosphaerae TaxID=1672749 RepID=A0A1Q9AH63_9HYPH|nr:DUF1127 domain-containing protein [Xaviernesmea rhizosphaerae]OLP54571.1 hypothetical protein BJF92_04020 [Xaviernesmea rhizosphaerae]
MRATETHCDPIPSRGAFAASLHGLTNMVVTLVRLVRNRQAAGSLGDLTDAQLDDIGITRKDLSSAVTSRFFEDPTQHLSQAARRRSRERYERLRR